MTINEKNHNCKVFFDALYDMLKERYEVLESCNRDMSAYLCPIGTTGEVTYYGKPEESFRISDHWNWYSNTTKCSDPRYIQCYSTDFPWARCRPAEGMASSPRKASSVCVFRDGKYHVVYGERYDRKTRTWLWIDDSPREVLSKLGIEL